jgi:excisionase family DNA binding protein
MSVLDGLNTRFLTTAEMAAILRRSVSWVQKAATVGRIPGAINPAGHWLFRRETIEEWLSTPLAATPEATPDPSADPPKECTERA